MDIQTLGAIAQENLNQIINNEVSNAKGKSITNAIGKVMQVELAKIKYQQHIGKSEKIPFFEGKEG